MCWVQSDKGLGQWGRVRRKESWCWQMSNTDSHWLGRVLGKTEYNFLEVADHYQFLFSDIHKNRRMQILTPWSSAVCQLYETINSFIVPSCGHFSICSKIPLEPSLERHWMIQIWLCWAACKNDAGQSCVWYRQQPRVCTGGGGERKGWDPWRRAGVGQGESRQLKLACGQAAGREEICPLGIQAT